MRHKWSEPERYWGGDIVCFCEVCQGVRVRKAVAGVDYVNAPGFHLDGAGIVRKGWKYQDTPRSCPGKPLEQEDGNGQVAKLEERS